MATHFSDAFGVQGCSRWIGITASTAAADSDAILIARHRQGSVIASSTESVTSLTLYGISATSTGTRRAMKTSTGGSVTMAISGGESVTIPEAAFSREYLVLVGDAAASLTVTLKT